MFPTLWMSVLWASETTPLPAPHCRHHPPRLGSHVVGEPLRTIPTLPGPLKAPLQPRCCSSQCCHPRKCHINSSTAEAWEGWISGPAATMKSLVWGTEARLKRRERRVDGGEWGAVSGISLLIKNGFVSLLSVTLLLGWEAKWADTHVEGLGGGIIYTLLREMGLVLPES